MVKDFLFYLGGFIFALGENWCKHIVDFMVKWPTSGFEAPTGSAKMPHAIARVELYILPKFDPNRSTHIRGDNIFNF